ncbi:hypothetical protein VTJ04DRAFT_6056 [Mycothermus thermophilus]|uniref:uncharacterized protein n=1 Tax=Humicola insolens TaxID=85995 RepID=UPI0037429DB8
MDWSYGTWIRRNMHPQARMCSPYDPDSIVNLPQVLPDTQHNLGAPEGRSDLPHTLEQPSVFIRVCVVIPGEFFVWEFNAADVPENLTETSDPGNNNVPVSVFTVE